MLMLAPAFSTRVDPRPDPDVYRSAIVKSVLVEFRTVQNRPGEYTVQYGSVSELKPEFVSVYIPADPVDGASTVGV